MVAPLKQTVTNLEQGKLNRNLESEAMTGQIDQLRMDHTNLQKHVAALEDQLQILGNARAMQ